MALQKICPHCQKVVDEDALFCDKCGTDLRNLAPSEVKQCLQCGAALEEGVAFCAACGAKVTDTETAAVVPAAKTDTVEQQDPIMNETIVNLRKALEFAKTVPNVNDDFRDGMFAAINYALKKAGDGRHIPAKASIFKDDDPARQGLIYTCWQFCKTGNPEIGDMIGAIARMLPLANVDKLSQPKDEGQVLITLAQNYYQLVQEMEKSPNDAEEIAINDKLLKLFLNAYIKPEFREVKVESLVADQVATDEPKLQEVYAQLSDKEKTAVPELFVLLKASLLSSMNIPGADEKRVISTALFLLQSFESIQRRWADVTQGAVSRGIVSQETVNQRTEQYAGQYTQGGQSAPNYVCPRCKSDNIQSFPMAFQNGISNMNSVSVGAGFAGKFGVGTAINRGIQQTQISKITAPPAKKRYLFKSLGCLLALCLVQLVIGGIFGSILGWVVFAAGIYYFIYQGAYLWNRDKYPQLMEQWQHSYICMKCGNIFRL